MRSFRSARIGIVGAGLGLAGAFAAIYLPDIGHGFVKDDFSWIARSRIGSAIELARLFVTAPSGFFRPLVSLSFALNERVCGLGPWCYGVFNFTLALACAVAMFVLARSLSMRVACSLLVAAIWIFNWHGISMAVLWISGRTALLLVLLAALATAAFVRHRIWLALALTMLAMFSKEEALLLPVILTAWAVVESRCRRGSWGRRSIIQFAGGSIIVVVVYLLLRHESGAFTPSTAPVFYRLDFSLTRVVENLPAYLDRSTTFAAVIVTLWAVTARPPFRSLHQTDGAVVVFGVMWLVGGLALTLFLPVRSSLYACLPSVGSALMAGALVDASSRSVPFNRLVRAAAVGVALPFVLWPVYAARHRIYVREAELSTTTVEALREVALQRGPGTIVLLKDDRSRKPSLDGAFGTLVQEAADLMVNPRVVVWIDPPPTDADQAGLTKPARFDSVLALRGGAVTAVP